MERIDEIIEIIENTPEGETPNLAGFTAEELSTAASQVKAAGREAIASLKDGTAEDQDTARAQVATGVAALAAINAENEARKTAAAELEDQAAVFGDGEEPTDEVVEEPEEADEVEAEPVPVQASTRASLREMVKRRPAELAPRDDVKPPQVLHAAIGQGDEIGGAFGTIGQLGEAMTNRFRNLTPSDEMAEVRSPVARLRWSEEFSVDPADGAQNFAERLNRLQFEAQAKARADLAKLQAGQAGAILQAATGICGPAEPIYDQYTIIGTDGMFGVPTLGARRGSVSVPDSLSYVDFDGEQGVAFPYTSAEGAAGTKQKVCLNIACDTPTTFEVIAYSTCLTYSNFMGQFYPERVGASGMTALAAHAHRVNKILMDEAEAIAVSDGTAYGSADGNGGTIVQFGQSVAFHAAVIRDKYRMPLNSVIDVHVPHWVAQALFADALARQSTVDYNMVTAKVENLLAGQNVRVFWVHDWEALTEKGVGNFPATVDLLMFPAGTVVRLTGETLDLGVVRDSTLNTSNEFRTFVETFDGIAKIGHEITLIQGVTVSPTGEVGQQVAITHPTGS